MPIFTHHAPLFVPIPPKTNAHHRHLTHPPCFHLCRKIGVSSIREYEGKHLKEAERLAERRVAMAAQLARVRNQLEYESAANPEADVEKISAEVESLTTALEGLKEQEAAFAAASEEVHAEVTALEKESAEYKAKLDGLEETAKKLKAEARTTADNGKAGNILLKTAGWCLRLLRWS